ncbi:MAG TPA: AAA family ATPase [Kofleriaceae bacterium]|nr:AAA family ATPase [Kofleriaceae bacterium]
MRILAIRGCNLASLAGEFEIDLARPPFGGAGVFAIVGNTGAGKSTLLDALCVALFDRTPRLTNHSRVVVGRGDDDPGALGAQDVRTLLRRGAAQGWAEVDFEAGDARRYRARWSVRRARGQTDGTLQDQQVTLTALDGSERLGGTKTETLRAIVARLGLSFDQFRRSALLAQGEFAAFLRADGRDRSELLERMTGTEIYSRLSVAAHVKASLAEQRLRDAQHAAFAIPVLDDAARQAAEADLALAEEARVAARARHAAADAAARWLGEAARRARALADADSDHGRALAAAAGAEAARAELALVRRAEQLRAPWEDAARIEQELRGARADADAAAAALAGAGAALEAISARRAALVALHEPVRAARLAAGIVERAAGADAGGGADELVRAAGDDAAWIAARVRLAAEIAGWHELDARFAQHAALGDAIAALDRALRDQSDASARLRRQRAKDTAEHRAAAGKLADAQRKAESFHKRRGLSLDAARKLEDQARTYQGEIERLVAIAEDARHTAAAREEVERQLAAMTGAAATDLAERARIMGAQGAALALRAERGRVAEELRRAAGYEHARAELRAGEECPLCGATEHPWQGRGAFDGVIRDAEARLAEVVRELDAHTAALAELAARGHAREREGDRLTRERAALAAAAVAAAATWRAKLTELGELLLEADPALAGAAALAAERAAAARRRLEEARDVRHQAEAATKAAQEALAEVQLWQSNVDQLAALIADHDRRLAELAASIERQEGERASRLERRAELAADLEASIARWRAALPEPEPAPARGRRRAGVPSIPDELTSARGAMAELAAAWRARAGRVADADAAGAAALAAIERQAREAERAVAEHTARHLEHARRREALSAAGAEAVSRLDAARVAAGFDAEELRRLLSSEPARAEALAERIAAVEREVDRTRAVVSERRRLVDDHAAARPEAPVWSEAPGAALGGTPGAVARLGAGGGDVASPGAALGGAPGGAAAVSGLGPDASAEALAAELRRVAVRTAELAAAVEIADAHVARLVAALAADADARARRAGALAQVQRLEAGAEVDRILGEVMGSHDGKLFRSFAQSLTLDGLLSVANAHLDELAPRYQLERVPRHDLELQVIDRDLGAEVRSVQSLSGGESFLVSLALALGLSSMSAHDVRVRTLLIDEGFGTLDPSTLDSALSVLDALQATGRQVGVISHVPALVERVGAHVRVIQRGGGRSEVVVA